MSNMDIKVIVATHKKYSMPSDPMYLPLHVGREGKEDLGFTGDNTGDNISIKNPRFCELTGVYWVWKNLDGDYIGLSHYRRYFSYKKGRDKFDSVLSYSQAKDLLGDVDVLVPKIRNYYIETVYSHYSHTFHNEDLDVTREIISERYPDYIKAFDYLMKGRKVHLFNMFIMKRELFDGYCEWLFDILFELENRLDISSYSVFEARVYGRVSERLLDVYLNTNGIRYKEVPVIYMGKINWYRKITGFLKAKFFGVKYKQSF